MASSIDSTKPNQGSALTSDVRSNFAYAKAEIDAITITNSGLDWGTDGIAATYVSATTFTVIGDKTSAFHTGRPLKCTGGADVYTEVVSSAYTTLTTVTVLSTTTLNASMDTVYASILSTDTTSANRNYYPEKTYETPANIENHAIAYDNVLRWIPLTYHAALEAGTNTTDMQPYIVNALTDRKIGGTNKVNSGRLFFPFMPAGYRVESTITINDHRGLTLEFESKQIFSAEADTASNCQLQWYGNATTSVISLQTLAYGITIINPSINCQPSTNAALCGIQIGANTGTTAARNINIHEPFITKARFGIAVAFADNVSVDAAPIKIYGGILHGNNDAGLIVAGGNCLVSTHEIYYSANGASPTTDTYNAAGIGANTYVSSGQVHEYDRTATGTTVTSADVYQQNGTYGWWGGWSEVYGVMVNNVNNTNQKPLTIQSVRHYTALMTDTNTPTSLIIRSPGTTVISCLLFGDCQLTSGLSGAPVLLGVQFYNGADIATVRPTLGKGTFKGTGVDTQHSLMHLGNLGNTAQILMGGAEAGVSLASLGTYEPQILSIGTAKAGTGITESIIQWLGAASGDSTGTMYVANASYGSIGMVFNGYWSSATQITPINTSAAVFVVTLGDTGSGIKLQVYDPNGSAAAFNYSSMVSLGGWKVGTTNGYRTEGVMLPPQRSADPTFSSAGFWTGGIYYNTTSNKLKLGVAGTSWETITSA